VISILAAGTTFEIGSDKISTYLQALAGIFSAKNFVFWSWVPFHGGTTGGVHVQNFHFENCN